MASWASEHLRPRDVYVTAVLVLIAVMAIILAIVSGRENGTVIQTLGTAAFGAVTTVTGYYFGHREAIRATESAEAARTVAARLRGEVAQVRAVAARAIIELKRDAEDYTEETGHGRKDL